MKKIIFVILTLFVTTIAFTQSDSNFGIIDNNDGSVTINRYFGSSNNVNIPDRINNKIVTAIGDGVFRQKNLRTVTIPNTIIYIGYRSFAENQLENINLPDSILYINGYAFTGNRLVSIVIPNSVRYIGPQAFSNNNLKDITLGTSVSYIGIGSFHNNNLTSVIVPDSVLYIGAQAFLENRINRIVIGKYIILDHGSNTAFNCFPNNFDSFYERNINNANEYYYQNNNWSIR